MEILKRRRCIWIYVCMWSHKYAKSILYDFGNVEFTSNLKELLCGFPKKTQWCESLLVISYILNGGLLEEQQRP